jgi:hypothetical protein
MNIDYSNVTEYYRTSDLHLACAVSLFFPLDFIENDSSQGKSVFVFKRVAGLDGLIQQYWQNTLQVSPQQYAGQLRLLKTRLYEARSGI